jgi:hypothetical protein
MTTVGAMRIKSSGEVAGQNPEDPDPDRDVEHAVIVFVVLTFNDFFHEGFGFRVHSNMQMTFC